MNDIANWLEEIAPSNLAEDWDKVGLQVGSRGLTVKRVLLALDPLPPVIEEAIKIEAQLILCHHPLFLKPLSAIETDLHLGKQIEKVIRERIAILVAHTNLDKSPRGVSYQLAKQLGLKNIRVLAKEAGNLFKLVVFVPANHADKLREVIGNCGAGKIGEYSYCSFSTKGIGRFLPGVEAKPAFGKIGSLNQVEEERIEVVVSQSRLVATVEAMLAAHPYEEVAYDIYPLRNKDNDFGYGCIGELKNQLSLDKFIELVKSKLSPVRFSGGKGKITTVAVCGGSGAGLIEIAQKAGADAFVTAEVKYHLSHRADELGMVIVSADHDVSEKFVLDYLAKQLSKKFAASGLEVFISQVKTSPWSRSG